MPRQTNRQVLPFVIVEWEDAWGDTGESVSSSDAHVKHKPAIYRTHGYLLYEDEAGVSLTNEECVDDGSFRGRNFINRPLIRSIEFFNLTRARKKAASAPSITQADTTE